MKTLLPHALMHDVDFEAILFIYISRPLGGDKKDLQGNATRVIFTDTKEAFMRKIKE